jgi:hypothetical protein
VSASVSITLDTRPPTVSFGAPRNLGGNIVIPYGVDEPPDLLVATLETVPGGILVPVEADTAARTLVAAAPAGANALKLVVRVKDDVLNEGIYTLDFAITHFVLIAQLNVYARLLGRMVIATKLGHELRAYSKLFFKSVLRAKLGAELKTRKILSGWFKIGDD